MPRAISLIENLSKLTKSLSTHLHQVNEDAKKLLPPILPQSQFSTLCQMCCLTSEMEIRNASKTLHDFGSCIHFSEDPVLYKFIIINPNWLTHLIASIISTKHKYDFHLFFYFQNSSLYGTWHSLPLQVDKIRNSRKLCLTPIMETSRISSCASSSPFSLTEAL